MAAEVEPRQYWVRSANGKTWGPLTFASLDLFVANKIIEGRCQVSVDGERFADPGRFPDVRDAFPKEMWGSTEPLPGLEPVAPVLTPAGPAGRPPARPAGPPVMHRPPTGGAPKVSTPPVVPAARKEPKTDPTVARPAPVAPAPVAPPAAAAEAGAMSGTLGDDSVFRVYYRLAATHVTGQLKLETGGTTYGVFFKKGVPQQARSSAAADGVLQYMGEKGLLSAEAVTKAEAAAPQFGGDPIGAAFALGLVTNPGDFVAALSGHSVGLLKKVLMITAGTWSFDGSAPPPPTGSQLGNKWALLMQGVRALTGEEVRRRLGPRLTAPVMKSGNLVTLEELALTAQEARVAASFDGVRSLAQLGEVLGDGDLVARVGYALAEVELAGFANVRNVAPPPEPVIEAAPILEPEPPPPPKPAVRPVAPAGGPVPRPQTGQAPRPPPVVGPAKAPGPPVVPAAAPRPNGPPVVAPAKPPGPPVAPAAKPPATAGLLAGVNPVDPSALQAVLAKLEKANHFDVLGLPQTATSANVKTAYLQLVKAWHPDTTPTDAAAEVRPLREKIFARINDANTALSDDAARAQYLEELAAGGDEKVDMARIFKAEDLFTKACIIAKARKYAEAVAMFEEAIKLNDQEAEFHAWRAFAQFMAASDKKAAFDSSMKGIQQALKMLPKCAQAAYFAGQMHKLLGDQAGAGQWFKKTLELDGNHLDAQRELRLIK